MDDVADDEGEGDAVQEWRDAAPPAPQIAAEVATLRGQPTVLDASTAVGTLPGVASVGARGQATWTMGLDVAPGVAGMTPDLSITYDSNAGNGLIGVGFGLGGLSTIRRCVQTIRDDGASGGLGWTNADALCLGGDRLVLESGISGEDGAQYRLAHDPSVRIVEHAPISTISSYFEAFLASGHILTYGTATGTLWRGPNPAFAQPFVWGLTQRRDRFANTIDYAYEFPTPLPTGPGEMRISTIRYGGTGAANTRRQVDFSYEDEVRPDVIDTWWFGAHQRVTSRLSQITTSGPGGAVVRSYVFTYEVPIGAAERSRLVSLRLCDAANVCMPPTHFEWEDRPDENWNHGVLDWEGDVLYGLDAEELVQTLMSMRGALVTDLDGDLAHELLLRQDGTGITPTTFWRPVLEHYSFEATLPSPPALPQYLDSSIADLMLEHMPTGELADLLARVQPPLTAAVVNADGDRRSDILVPRTPFGNAVDLDPDGYLFGQGFYLSHGQSTPPDADPQVIDVVSYQVHDPSGELTYAMVPIDHDGDLATDAWLCRGETAANAHWVLMRGEPYGAGSVEPFTFHPTDLACSVHDELSVDVAPGRGQRLLVIGAYNEDGDPTDDSARNMYSRLDYDLASGVSNWAPSLLPRDRYQRWHDRECRNGIAYSMTGLPVYGAGLGLDRRLDVNGDGLQDVLRFELAVGDSLAQQGDIVEDLRGSREGLDAEYRDDVHICSANVAEHRDAVIRLWQNTGEGYVDAGVVHEFAGIAHANYWLNFVGSQVIDANDDSLADLVLPSRGIDGHWTLLASRGDGSFDRSGVDLPEGWPAYSSDETWEEDLDLGGKVRVFTMAQGKHERPALVFVGFIDREGDENWNTVANVWSPGSANSGDHVVGIVDGLGRSSSFGYEMVDVSSVDGISGPRVPLPVKVWVATQMCVESQTEGYQQDTDPAVDIMTSGCTSFDYGGAALDRWGRGLLGFEEVRSYGPGWGHEGQMTYTRYSVDHDALLNDYPAAGRPTEQLVLQQVDDASQGGAGDFDSADDTLEISRTNWLWTSIATPLAGGRTLLTYASEVRQRAYATSAASPPSGVLLLDPDAIDGLDDYAENVKTEVQDEYGTLLSSVSQTTLGERVEVTAEGVVHDTVQWLLGRASRVEVESCAHAGDCKTRVTEYIFDPASGLPSETVIQPGDPELELSTSVLREGHGNVWHSSTAAAAGVPRVTITAWDDEGVHPLSTTNSVGHVSHVIHDIPSGALRAVVDAGGTTQTFSYDGFYRETRRDRLAMPLGAGDGAPITTVYAAGGDPAWPQVPGVAMRVTTTQTGGQRVVSHLNRLGLPVLQVWRGALAVPGFIPPTIGAGVDVYQRTRFDIYGEVGEQSLPQWVGSEPLGWQHVDRDRLGREVRSVAPDGTVLSSTVFTHQTSLVSSTIATTFDANGRTSSVESDSDGRVVRSTDRLGVAICFTPGAFGDTRLLHQNCAYGAVGPQPVTTMEYDAVGRLRSETETAWGPKTYHYTAFGELDGVIDGNGDATSYLFDPLGRATSKTDTDGLTVFTWDTERPGFLSSEASPDGVVTSRSYDGFGRTRFEHTVVPSNSGPDDYVFENVWGPGDQLAELVYPEVDGEPGLRVRMQYDATGRLRAVSNAVGNALFWVWRTASASDDILTETKSGTANTTRGFHPTRGWPLRIDTLAGATVLQQLEYGWSPDGELNWREDEQNGIQRETFSYDHARRLTGGPVTLGGVARAPTPEVHYDALGNITSKRSALGDDVYAYDGDGKLLSVGADSVFHDGDGNVLSIGSRTYEYTPFNKLRTAQSGSTSLGFAYDASGSRVRRTAGAQQTISIGPLYERVLSGAASTNLNYHVMAGGRAVARVERLKSAGVWTTRVYGMHDDAFGSTTVLNNASGTASRRVSHDPWGAARRANDWTVAANSEDTAGVGLGFTGHRAALDTGLIDMRGRMYDPRLARFTSADPIVSDALDPQAWNRYSYVGNRPLQFSDPTGWKRDEITEQIANNPDAFGVDGAGFEGEDLVVQITIAYDDGFSPGVGWRDVGGGFWGMGPTTPVGPQFTPRGNGWYQFGNRLYHKNGFSIGEDEREKHAQDYYARLYPPKEEPGDPVKWARQLSRGLDITAWLSLRIGEFFDPRVRAISTAIDVINAGVSKDPERMIQATLAGMPGFLGTIGRWRPSSGAHTADVTVFRDGHVVQALTVRSGGMTAEQKALGFPRSTLATHTERKAVSLSLRSGDTMLIQGTNPPCSSCKGAMNLVAKITGAEIHYTWNGNIWSAGKPR